MAIKEINKQALDNFKKNQTYYWILGIFCGLLMGGCYALSLISNVFLLIIIPFLIVPIFFAGHVAFIAIQQNEKITFGKALNYFLLYFKAPFNSSFAFMKSFFKCLLVLILSTIIFSVCSYQILNAIFPARMHEFITELNALINSSSFTIDDVNKLFDVFKDIYLPMTYTAVIPAVAITTIFAVYFNTTYSMNVYFRLACPIKDPTILLMISKIVGTKTKGTFKKDYFYLIWPLYIIMGIGFTCGIIASIFMNRDYAFASIFAVTLSLGAASLFLPFYFPKMQALYESYSPIYQGALIAATSNLYNQVINNQEPLNQNKEDKSKTIDIDVAKKKEDNGEEK